MLRFVKCAALVLVTVQLSFAEKLDDIAYQADSTKSDTTKVKKATKELPLEPGRNISFNTSEGSWMSIDVSPDGSTIVFDMLGDLYTMPASGGKAIALTAGMPYDTHPRFSPDGSTVSYISDKTGSENLWTISVADKKETQFLRGRGI